MTGQANEAMCTCVRMEVGPGIYPRCRNCNGFIDPPPARPVVSPPDTAELLQAIRRRYRSGDLTFTGLLAALDALAGPRRPDTTAGTLREFEQLPVRRVTQTTVVLERGPLDDWRARAAQALEPK